MTPNTARKMFALPGSLLKHKRGGFITVIQKVITQGVKARACGNKWAVSCSIDMPLELTKEAEIKLKTLAESLNFENESVVVNELFYQFVLNQEPEKRKMIMAVYQINVKGTPNIK